MHFAVKTGGSSISNVEYNAQSKSTTSHSWQINPPAGVFIDRRVMWKSKFRTKLSGIARNGVKLVEADARLGERVNVRRLVAIGTVRPDLGEPEVIGQDEDDVGLGGRRGMERGERHQRRGEGEVEFHVGSDFGIKVLRVPASAQANG